MHFGPKALQGMKFQALFRLLAVTMPELFYQDISGSIYPV